MKKAMKWLSENNVEFTFHDYRKDGLNQELLQEWIKQFGWEQVINKRGTTWRSLDDSIKETIDDSKALSCIVENPAMIKRPFLCHADEILIGFSTKSYEAAFNQ